ncbi:hypothetical protein [Beijerinckia sp. L45]|uniref:hypothetical protein n=1 Tax=Beijerinckia sp. L45 TaxID=1641855 RepID=UPI00131CE532|nr:hypothetical protein [Beijerinckia sp. L45]
MDLLLVKLTLTPLLMAGVSYASRRWGGAIGGLLAGLPLTAAPISMYLTAEQGHAFAAQAALASIAGNGAVTLSYLVYVEASRRFLPAATITLSVLAFAVGAIVLHGLDLSLGPVLCIDGVLILLVLMRCPRLVDDPAPSAYSRWDLPARLVAATAMVLVVTLSAQLIGPHYSGLFSTMPALGWPLIVFAHRRGRADAMAMLLGIVKGLFGVIAFYLVVTVMLPKYPAIPIYALALFASVLLTAGWLVQRRFMVAAVPR